MLWLDIRTPYLALDLYRGYPNAMIEPLAIVTQLQNRQQVYRCNQAARRRGVRPGMLLSAAQVQCAELLIVARDETAETEALVRIADWARQFTATVSLQEPADVLLEIGGSLALFGGLDRLLSRITVGLKALDYTACIAVAPTPTGARILNRARQRAAVTDSCQLRSILEGLPLQALDLAPDLQQLLHQLGLTTIADCLRLPRAGLAQRVGQELLDYLDRARGCAPDPQPLFQSPAGFVGSLPLVTEVSDAAALLFAYSRLVSELCAVLLARDAAVRSLRLNLLHQNQPAGEMLLAFHTPTRDREHLLTLIRERCHQYKLTRPVTAVKLLAERLLPFVPDQALLFDASRRQTDMRQVLERLRVRFGAGAVMQLCAVADHRPEQAWRGVKAYTPATPVNDSPQRPLWLLNRPRRLTIRHKQPWLDGTLELLQGPERIESGWWDGADIERDYYIAQNPLYQRFWIYRELRQPRRWFLHGVFG